jgi:hypothetical protein
MALQGTLRDFSIGEIFQLIGQQQKTGVLTVSHDSQIVHVIFHRGGVVGAADGDHGEDDRVAERLARMGLLTGEEIQELRVAQGGSLRRMAACLVAQGKLTKEELAHLLGVEIQNVLFRLFLWEDGRYEFSPRTVRFDREFTPGVPAEEIVLDGLRARDEWASVQRAVPDWDAIPERRTSDPGGPSEPEGGEAEGRLAALVDGTASVRAVIDRSRLSDFEACRILANLLSEGYIRVAPRIGPEQPMRWQERYPPSALAACVGAVIGCGLLLGLLLSTIVGNGCEGGGLVLRGQEPRSVFAMNRSAVLRTALGIYRLEHGRYPARLEALVEAGLVGPKDASFPLFYERRGGEYALLLSGR